MKLRLTAISTALACCVAASSAKAQSFGNFYAFGDSLTDCCNTPYARYTNYANKSSPNWADQVPLLIGASYTASPQSNFAIGGAQSGDHNINFALETGYGAPTGLLPQVARFRAGNVPVGPRDIVGLWIGTNDILAAALPTTPTIFQPIGARPDVATFTSNVIGNVRTGIDSLVASGFRNIILVSPYDLSQPATYAGYGASNNATTRAYGQQYSVAIRDQLATLYTPGVNTYFLDTLTLLNRVQANPAAYGFVHYTTLDTCYGSPTCYSASTAVQNTYVFNDNIHTTTGFDALMSKYIGNMINAREALSAPGDIAQGAGVSFSNSLIDRLDAQRRAAASNAFDALAAYMPAKVMGPVSVPQDDKFSVFVEGAGARLSQAGVASPNGPANSDIGANFAGLTIGAGYQAAKNLFVGAAFNFYTASTDLAGLSRTHLDSNSFQGALFGSLSYPHFFLDGAVTYGLNKLGTSRPGVIDTIRGSVDGNTFTLAGRSGYLFDVGTMKAGPIAEFAYSNVRLGSYSERGDDLLTLGVNGQNFDGLTGGVGAQIRANIPFARASFNPFINLTAQHDFLGGVRTVTSFSTDAPLLLINTAGGRTPSDIYGKVSGGFDANLGNGFKGLLTASSTFGRSGGDSYSLNGGLQYQF
ncbi:autotransporter domain-containing protein [Bradyrhizobium sp. 141]|uniref:autotransporter domain-containing protein n=1 Tax=Bradyrhizobium sp. 141 TaxID=2782617 RepID=UPI001FF716C6|nr:autotransporter domain-containing protein [Bradyrhizobium sp. 141]MCK1716923.1 autotransporter domain-containing protein [Bradyrhizobium sp. 141]